MFANAYTSNVVETKQATVVAQNTEEENKTDNTEKTAENNNPAVDNNKTEHTNNIEDNTSTNEEDSKDLSLEFTYQNARKATEVTEQTTNDIIKGQENTDKTNKDLQKQSIKSQKDVQKVNQEVAKAESTYAKMHKNKQLCYPNLKNFKQKRQIQIFNPRKKTLNNKLLNKLQFNLKHNNHQFNHCQTTKMLNKIQKHKTICLNNLKLLAV